MDWLDEAREVLRKKLQNVSLKRSMAVYILIAVMAVIFFTGVTVTICKGWETIVYSHYSDVQNTHMNMESFRIEWPAFRGDMTDKDQSLLRVIDFIRTWCTLIYSVGAVFWVTRFFYKEKLEVPMELLKTEAAHIGRGELDFSCIYRSEDEMGELCDTFEQMRHQLAENREKIEDLMEGQRRLNAAFAHDLRTPLTVLRGYTDFLSRYCPEGKVTAQQLQENLELMNQQVIRLIDFCNTMKQVTSMEELEVHRRETRLEEISKKVQDMAEALNGTRDISVSFSSCLLSGRGWIMDEMVVMEVLENLVSNALRYALTKVEITLDESEDGRKMIFYVQDDGPGFTREGLRQAVRPYYRDKEKAQGNHYGIGLYICKMLCEKHGGNLSLSNSIDGGAILTTEFYVK